MFIKQSYDEEFEHLLLDLKDKYPKTIFQLEGIDSSQLDITQYSKNYFIKTKNVADITIDQNANVQIKNVATYKSEMHKGVNKLNSLFVLWRTAKKIFGTRYANKLIEEEIIKDINIQDSTNIYLPYCWAFDIIDIVEQGLPFITNKPSSPPLHADTLLRHVEQLIMFASRQMMGATAIPNVLVIYSALLQKDIQDETYYVSQLYKNSTLFEQYLKQEFQKFIYTINQPIRDTQSPFTNITLFDYQYLRELCSMYVINNKHIDVDFAMYIQKQFLKYFIEFNKSHICTFPVLTAQFKVDDNYNIIDQEFFDFIAEMNLEFANINIFAAKSLTALSSCCRLINNVEDIIAATKTENMNLIGGSSIKVGSFGVTTINLPRIALIAKRNKEVFFNRLKELAIDCFNVNHCRRELIIKMINNGQMPLYDFNFIKLDNQYSTLGINGLYEAVKFMGYDILSQEGQQFAIEILQKLQLITEEHIKKYGYRCNIEQIPAESTAIRFAQADALLYKQNDYKLYSNQFIPLTNETNLINRISLQSLFEKYFSGGTILHANVVEKIVSKDVMKKLIAFIIKSGVQYHAINYFFSECVNKHITISDSNICALCGGDIIQKYTRIVGFVTPISSWQLERREEFSKRVKYRNGNINIIINNNA